MTCADFMMNLWRWKCGMSENEKTNIDLDELRKTEWSSEFENLMRNRLVMGAFRYGKLKPLQGSKYDRVMAIMRRAELYSETGNLEYLVDCANFALCEFVEGNHPKRHFSSVDDGEHAKRKVGAK